MLVVVNVPTSKTLFRVRIPTGHLKSTNKKMEMSINGVSPHRRIVSPSDGMIGSQLIGTQSSQHPQSTEVHAVSPRTWLPTGASLIPKNDNVKILGSHRIDSHLSQEDVPSAKLRCRGLEPRTPSHWHDVSPLNGTMVQFGTMVYKWV